MRNLRKHIEKIYRKAAFQVVHDAASGLVIDQENLGKYVGKPVFTSDKMYADKTPVSKMFFVDCYVFATFIIS